MFKHCWKSVSKQEISNATWQCLLRIPLGKSGHQEFQVRYMTESYILIHVLQSHMLEATGLSSEGNLAGVSPKQCSCWSKNSLSHCFVSQKWNLSKYIWKLSRSMVRISIKLTLNSMLLDWNRSDLLPGYWQKETSSKKTGSYSELKQELQPF